VGQGKLYDNAVSGRRISSFQGGDSSKFVVFIEMASMAPQQKK
jgi:hypothetical protein